MRSYIDLFLALAALLSLASGLHFRKGQDPSLGRHSFETRRHRPKIEEAWITQRLDHFDPTDNRTWQMRYSYDLIDHKPNGPIFIYLGGEWLMDSRRLVSGQMVDLAHKHNGSVFGTEHRFYGMSRPLEDCSTDSMKYLSMDQALADIAYFIKHIKETYPGLKNSKVVIFGCSYSATLATWFRIKYPHLSVGVMASSAPLLTTEENTRFYEVVEESVRKVSGQECVDLIRDAMNELRAELRTPGGPERIAEKFHLCAVVRPDQPLDMGGFISLVAESIAANVQYDAYDEVKNICERLIKWSENSTALAALNQHVNAAYGSGPYTCLPGDFEHFLMQFNDSRWDTLSTAESMRQYLYQTCTEEGMYPTDSSPNQMFGTGAFGADFYVELCRELFKGPFTKNAKEIMSRGLARSRLFSGGLNPPVTNMVFTNGLIDPWYSIGIIEDLNESTHAVVISDSSHCKDLDELNINHDSEEMQKAKLKVQSIVSGWL